MNKEEYINTQISAIKDLYGQTIEALGIGGSFGAKTFDQYSDIDFFLLFSDANFFSILHDFDNRIKHKNPILYKSGLDYTSDFGFYYSYILDNGLTIDYYLNSRSTLNINQMRSKTHLIFDNSGYFTQIINESKKHFDTQHISQVADKIMYEYVSRLLKIRKSIHRNNISALFYYMDKIRHIMIGIDKSNMINVPYNSFHSDQDLRNMSKEYENFIISTIPSFSSDSIYNCFDTICKHINNSLKIYSNISNEQWDFEKVLENEIINLIQKKQWKL